MTIKPLSVTECEAWRGSGLHEMAVTREKEEGNPESQAVVLRWTVVFAPLPLIVFLTLSATLLELSYGRRGSGQTLRWSSEK